MHRHTCIHTCILDLGSFVLDLICILPLDLRVFCFCSHFGYQAMKPCCCLIFFRGIQSTVCLPPCPDCIMALVSQPIAVALLYGQLTKAANMEGGDSLSIAGAKRNIVIAMKSSKEWVQVFEMYMQFETDDDSNPLSESQTIGDMNESGRSLEVLFEACENAKVLTRLAQAA